MEQTKTKEKNREIDMLHGKLAGKLIMFALPLAFSTILQQLFNSADVAVVGRFAGSSALAAVGSCVALVGIFVNLITGLSVGPNAALANLIGQNKREQISAMLHTILTFALILGIGLMCLGFIIAKPVLVVSGTPDSVMDQAMLYIRIYLLSIPFMLLLSVIFIAGGNTFVHIYTASDAVAMYALIRMQHVCSLEGLTATYEVESAALRGMGKSLEPAIITILGTVVFRMIWMVTVFKWVPTYNMLMNVYVASWVVTGGLIFIIYMRHMKKEEKRKNNLVRTVLLK